MKNTLLFLLSSFCLLLPSYAQTTLPTSWSFTTATLPSGWTTSGTGFYSASGNTPPALKFDGTGDWLQIFFADDPGPLSYYLAGNSFSGGTFTVEESVNGTTWSALRIHTNPAAGTYVLFTDTPNIASRYIRFFYTAKVTGNIGLDDVTLSLAAASPTQEINVKLDSAGIINGTTAYFNSPVGVTTPISFLVENSGTANYLHISSAVISGANANEFVLTTIPDSVAPVNSGNLILDFTPTLAGTRLATLTIANDDANENPYIIKLYGVGGSYATEPVAQATNLVFSNIKSYRFSASFTPAVPNNDGYLILRKKDSVITETPTDGMIYSTGDYIGNAQVVLSGTANTFSPTNIVAGTNYYFSVFAFNGPGQYRNYLTSSPLSNNVNTLSTMMGNYYAGISTTDTSFLTDLHNLINPHTSIFYGNYQTTIIPLFESRDTTGGQKVVTCVYSGFNYVYTEPYGWSVMSREHTYCHSWMPSFPADAPQEKPEYNDQHHLFPAQFSNANQVRSNYPLGEVVTISNQFLDCKFGKDINGRDVFEPRDEHKGDAARALMYMAVCYNGISGNNWKFKNPIGSFIPYGQEQDILKKWHFQDPPDNWEISRNDFLDSLQGNRNPFIDSVNFACYIDFLTMTKIDNPSIPCNSVGINSPFVKEEEMSVYPNPNDGNFIFTCPSKTLKIEILNVLGEKIYQKLISEKQSISNTLVQTDIPGGIYFLLIYGNEKTAITKFAVSK